MSFALPTLGDQAQSFQSSRLNTALKLRLTVLTEELSTGRIKDLATHLGGDNRRLADVERLMALTTDYTRAAKEAGQTLSIMQSALATVDQARGKLATETLKLGEVASPSQVSALAGEARQLFGAMVTALNARFGSASVFAGAATDRPALQPAPQMLAALSAAVAGAQTNADVIAAVDSWFDDPAGGFATWGYQGDDGAALSRRIDEGTTLSLPVRADDPAIRDLLKSAALAALADDPGLSLAPAAQGQLLSEAGRRALSGAQPLVGLRGDLGRAEQRVDEATVRQAARHSALNLIHIELTGADNFDTATALQEVQVQLETHYTLTARLSRLNLVEYLR
jgi:flagellar hook-associated protein 3 FlgL